MFNKREAIIIKNTLESKGYVIYIARFGVSYLVEVISPANKMTQQEVFSDDQYKYFLKGILAAHELLKGGE